MKKILISILVAICLVGVVYLGFVIFKAKNIESVELVGEMQTLYMVDDKIDFENAKLKVTYKNGNIRMIDPRSNDVKVDLFTTSTLDHRTMNITYKSFTNKVEYNVIQKGTYYIDRIVEKTSTESTPVSSPIYNKDTTSTVLSLEDKGAVRYYKKIDGKWFLNDGIYDKSYSYSIKGDSIYVKLGENDSLILKANYDAEKNNSALIYLSSTKELTSSDGEFVTSRTQTTYKWISTETDRRVASIKLDLTKANAKVDPTQTSREYVTFNVDQIVEDKEIYLEVNLVNQYYYIPNFYVRVSSEMMDNMFNTTEPNGLSFSYIYYETKRADLFYSVS